MLKYIKAISLVFLFVLFNSRHLLAQKTKELETLVVTATRTPKLLKDVPVITQVITAKDIERTDATNMQELLTSILPGVEFSFAMDQQTVLNFQGFGGNKILFLVDGNRIAGETMDNPDYTRLSLENVERIELVKGSASTLYGSQAMGAVINIITKKAKKGLKANVSSRWGEFHNQRYSSVLSYAKGRFSTTTSLLYTSIDEQKMKNIGDFTKVDASSSKCLRQKFSYVLSPELKLIGGGSLFKRTRELSDRVHRHFYAYGANVGLKMNLGSKDNLDMTMTLDKYEKTQELVPKHREVKRYTNTQNAFRLLYTHTFKPTMTFILGGDAMRDYLYSYQFEDVGDHSQYTADVFAQFDCDVLPKLNLVGALRYDYFSATTANRLTPKLSLMYKALPYLRLRSSYAMGFRSPTLKESYMVFNMANIFMIYGNEDLKSESSDNYQLSAEYARRNYNATLMLNHSKIRNRITTIWDASKEGLGEYNKGGMVYTNIDAMRITSFEASVSAKYNWGFMARLSYVYTCEHDENSDEGVALSMTRPHSTNCYIEYAKNWKNYGFALSLNGRYLAPVETVHLVENKQGDKLFVKTNYEGYQMWDLGLTQRVFKGIRLSFRIQNLFNYVPSYYNNNAPATTGRTYLGGLSLDLHKLY